MSKMNLRTILILIVIFSLGVSLRFYKLEEFPVQLNHDEVSQLYDAISIATTGKDIYNNSYPVMFKSVNDYKSPFYTYITAIIYLLRGGDELTVRLPGAIFGSLVIIAVFAFTDVLFKNRLISLVAAFITAVSPFEIFFSRKSFENGAGVFFMLIGFTFLISFIQKKRTYKLFLASLTLGSAMYTYFSHAIIIPLLLIAFFYIFRHEFRELKKLLLPLAFFVLLIIPIIFIVLTNPGARYRTATIFITQDSALGEITGLIQLNHKLTSRILGGLATANYSFNRYIDQFNPAYIFANGLDMTNQGPVGIGPLLLVQLPFLMLGILFILKSSDFRRKKLFIASWIFLGTIPSGLTFEPHSPHRIVMVFTMFNIISAVGFYSFYIWLQYKRKLKNVSLLLLLSLVLLNEIYFIHIYFVNYPYEKSEPIHYPFKQVAQYIWSQYPNFDQIIFDPLFGHAYPIIGTGAQYYLAYYGNYPPEKLQREYRFGDKEREVLFDKFSIRRFDWLKDQHLKNTLVIASDWELPLKDTPQGKVVNINPDRILKVFYYYNGTPAFYAVKF
ncbi:MAG: glycosyltransferase family 39 protein [Actinobacteria bacterium]|nr:glycosyltransferase family 39 protein [Actinomycetota bacterium]